MISIHNLTKVFAQQTVVENISFAVKPGEVLGFLGPNGAGKSTTMKMITGFLTPTSGHIEIFGKNIQTQAVACKQLLGYLPEGAPAYGDMTPRQFLQFIAQARRLPVAMQRSRLETVVNQLVLAEVLDQKIETLSKGFKRRVGLAQAILHNPKVLVLDEPTDGLDPNQKHQVRELIQSLAHDKIVIISTHILEEVTAVCTRAMIINQGKLVIDSTPAELISRSRYHGALRLKVGAAVAVESVLQALPEVAHIERLGEGNHFMLFPEAGNTLFAAINQAIQQYQWQVQELHMETGRLDEVFRQVTIKEAI